MKALLLPIHLLAATLLPACAQPPSKDRDPAERPAPPAAMKPEYLSESPLPEGWPAPGPYNEVARKHYPASRMAVTPNSSPNFGFWTLFKHIKRNDIPMTSPVEMTMKDTSADRLKMEEMGFLYQSPASGKPGPTGKKVTVRDVPALDVLAYTWQGPRNDAALAKARAAIEAALAAKNLKSTGYRLFGYNSPSVPSNKQTHELQALLE